MCNVCQLDTRNIIAGPAALGCSLSQNSCNLGIHCSASDKAIKVRFEACPLFRDLLIGILAPEKQAIVDARISASAYGARG